MRIFLSDFATYKNTRISRTSLPHQRALETKIQQKKRFKTANPLCFCTSIYGKLESSHARVRPMHLFAQRYCALKLRWFVNGDRSSRFFVQVEGILPSLLVLGVSTEDPSVSTLKLVPFVAFLKLFVPCQVMAFSWTQLGGLFSD